MLSFTSLVLSEFSPLHKLSEPISNCREYARNQRGRDNTRKYRNVLPFPPKVLWGLDLCRSQWENQFDVECLRARYDNRAIQWSLCFPKHERLKECTHIHSSFSRGSVFLSYSFPQRMQGESLCGEIIVIYSKSVMVY